MTISRRDPLRDLVALQNRMSRLFEESLRPGGSEEEVSGGAWTPSADIYETGDDFVLSLDLPGVQRDAIQILFEKNVLSVRGERKRNQDLAQGQRHRVECPRGAFLRNFTLPAGVDSDKITASCNDGVLTIRIPRSAATKSRQIQIG